MNLVVLAGDVDSVALKNVAKLTETREIEQRFVAGHAEGGAIERVFLRCSPGFAHRGEQLVGELGAVAVVVFAGEQPGSQRAPDGCTHSQILKNFKIFILHFCTLK